MEFLIGMGAAVVVSLIRKGGQKRKRNKNETNQSTDHAPKTAKEHQIAQQQADEIVTVVLPTIRNDGQ